MTDSLHDRIRAALDREQALAEKANTDEARRPWGDPSIDPVPHEEWGALVKGYLGGEIGAYCGSQDPARTVRRIEADRRVLARHTATQHGWCRGCGWDRCPDLLDLAARYDVAPEGGTE